MPESHAPQDDALTIHAVEFRGRGAEYFRIWVVNVALTVLTLGIYSAWAKVRTQRYFYGNTYLAGHSFEYHASAVRILIGRAIAVTLFAGYTLSAIMVPVTVGFWILILGAALPWLANSSIRFNARNTSWRNVRFRFTATYFEAFIAYVVWSVAALAIFFLIPYTRRVHDYFYVNHHRFGGRAFATRFSAGRIYAIYLIGFVLIVGIIAFLLGGTAAIVVVTTRLHDYTKNIHLPIDEGATTVIVALLFGSTALFVTNFVAAMVTNLAIGNATLEGGHKLISRISPWRLGWIVVSNTLLTLATLGLFFPFARVRLARYRMSRYALAANSDLDDFTAEALEQQSAIGEEIAGVFDFGFGL
ncbi:MAG: YjgN family protein [Rhizomicrobium sp.]